MGYSLSQLLKFVFLVNLRILSRYTDEQITFMNIHAYPAFKAPKEDADACDLTLEADERACWISAQAATMELSTIKPKHAKVSGP